VIDLSLATAPDGDFPVFPPASPIEKGWRVKNTGTCTWDSAYTLALARHSPDWVLSYPPQAVAREIMPGGMVDFWVRVNTPLTMGVHQAEWALQNGRGIGVGRPLTLGIEVAALPTGTPSPDVSLVASALEISPGEEAFISWTTSQAKAAYFYRSGQAWWGHPVEVDGSTMVEPDRTTTYELRIVKGDDTFEVHQITIEVLPFDPPKIKVFSIQPETKIDLGQCVDILWNITGRVNTVTILRNGIQYLTTREETGSTWDCPAASGIYRYTLEAVGPGGEVEKVRVLEVR
jgi:hypothetical protein